MTRLQGINVKDLLISPPSRYGQMGDDYKNKTKQNLNTINSSVLI
jgi:hypothetical protein